MRRKRKTLIDELTKQELMLLRKCVSDSIQRSFTDMEMNILMNRGDQNADIQRLKEKKEQLYGKLLTIIGTDA